MKILLVFCFVFLGCFVVPAQQERFVKPVDEAAKDASFLAFRAKLIDAAKRRDAKYILSVVDRDIKNSFGGNDGVAEFKEWWKIDAPGSKFWSEFLPVIENGGYFVKDGAADLFLAPYSFQGFPNDIDAYSHAVIFGNNVNLRAKPHTNAATLGKLSYNVVEITGSTEDKNDVEKAGWYEIKTLGGKKGFVKAEFVRSPLDYRAGFVKRNGTWKMIYFIAGD